MRNVIIDSVSLRLGRVKFLDLISANFIFTSALWNLTLLLKFTICCLTSKIWLPRGILMKSKVTAMLAAFAKMCIRLAVLSWISLMNLFLWVIEEIIEEIQFGFTCLFSVVRVEVYVLNNSISQEQHETQTERLAWIAQCLFDFGTCWPNTYHTKWICQTSGSRYQWFSSKHWRQCFQVSLQRLFGGLQRWLGVWVFNIFLYFQIFIYIYMFRNVLWCPTPEILSTFIKSCSLLGHWIRQICWMNGWKLETTTSTPTVDMLRDIHSCRSCYKVVRVSNSLLTGNAEVIDQEVKNSRPTLPVQFTRPKWAVSFHPDSKHTSKKDKIVFNKFKKYHQSAITSCNDLLNMYCEVCFPFIEKLIAPHKKGDDVCLPLIHVESHNDNYLIQHEKLCANCVTT